MEPDSLPKPSDRTRGQMLQRHKLEWKSLRKELEKKHNNELVHFRSDMAKKQGDMRKKLLGDSDLIQ